MQGPLYLQGKAWVCLNDQCTQSQRLWLQSSSCASHAAVPDTPSLVRAFRCLYNVPVKVRGQCAGEQVTAGTVNCDGHITVRSERAGDATVMADILRLVDAAQSRSAPMQRLADAVAGRFTYAMMGLSAATFAFWSSIGVRMFPQV